MSDFYQNNSRIDLVCISFSFKGRSHYSDNQSPTSNNHYFWGGCRRLSEVGKCLSMIGDWLSENFLADLRQPPFFRVVFDGRQMVVDDSSFGRPEVFDAASTTINKAAIQNEYTFDPEKCR